MMTEIINNLRVDNNILTADVVDFTAFLREFTEKGVDFRFRAGGISMKPFIRNNDILTISRVSFNYIRIGDVVAFSNPEKTRLIIHRVIRKSYSGVITKGDNSGKLTDGFIKRTDIIGNVTNIYRKGVAVSIGIGVEKYLIAWLSKYHVFYLLRRLCRITVL